MEITNVSVTLVVDTSHPALMAYATVTLDRCFIVKSIRLIEGQDGPFLSMPSKQLKDGTYQNLAHPINKQTREMFEEAILTDYKKITQGTNKKEET